MATQPLANESPEPMYSVTETARILNISDKLIWKQIHAGAFPAVRIGNIFRIPRAFVDTLAQGGAR